ncbi:toxic polypeptide, small, partial [Escherichia coli]
MALVAGERKPPHVAGMHLTTPRGPFLHLDHSRIAAKRCHYNSGGYMTLAELGMAF